MKIIRLFSLLFFFATCFSLQAQIGFGTIVYVDSSASGANNGTSWTDAYTDLQTALDSTGLMDTIWVTSHTYSPSVPITNSTDPRSKTFYVNGQVSLYGGFAGTETALDQRGPGSYTFLSGDLGVQNDSSDNAYHVVTMLSNSGTFDGFAVAFGNANGTSSDTIATTHILPNNMGGGILMDSSNAKISNCFIFANRSSAGGAGVLSRGGSPQFTGSLFSANITYGNNTNAGGGGGILNIDNAATFKTVNFAGNGTVNTQGGGGMRNENSNVQLDSTDFDMNFATNGDGGGAMYNLNSTPKLTTVVFDTNYTDMEAGAMYNDGSPVVLTDVLFIRNAGGPNGGGAIENDGGSDIVIENGIFMFNTSQGDGGAIQNWKSSPKFTNVAFVGNQADGDGGAIVNYTNCDPVFTNVYFSENTALGSGGALYNERNSNPVITNTIFSYNRAGEKGGAMAVVTGAAACSPILTNVTIVKNHADTSGGGIYTDGQGSGKIRNSIVHGNTAGRDADIDAPQSMLPSAVFNDIFGNEYYANGTTMPVAFTVEVFKDTANGDFTLSSTGPAVDSGDTSFYSASATPDLSSITTDIRGAMRVMGSTIDLGAYETCDTVLVPSVSISAFPAANNQLGDTILFTASAQNGGQHPYFEWRLNGIVVAFGNDSTYEAIAGVDYGKNDTLSVSLRSSEACADSIVSVIFTQDIITGIETQQQELVEINIYPNPNTGNFTLKSQLQKGKQHELQITDIRGKVVHSEIIGNDSSVKSLNLNGKLRTGMYFLIIKNSEKVQGVSRFVVQ